MRDLIVTSLPVRLRTAISMRVPYLMVAILLCGPAARCSIAQGHGQPGGAHAQGPGPASMPPGMGRPGQFRQGMGAGMPGPQGQRIHGSADPAGVKGPPQELKINPDKLPDNYSPPGSKDELMAKSEPLAMQDEIDKLKKDLAKYQIVLRKAVSTDADKALIKNGIRYRLSLMCLKENRQQLSKLHDDLLRDMNSAASVPEASNPAVIKTFRQFVLQELINQAAPLLATQNFYVRLHVAILLGELDLTQENPKYGFKVEAFAPACEPLVAAIVDPKQPEAIKVAAVNGMARILRLGNPNVVMRTKVADAIVAELKNKQAHPWYQMRLAGALSVVDIELDQAKRPFVVDVLKAVVADDDRTWSVRAEAAKSLGRVPIPPAANPPSVTRAIGEFALKLAKAAQQAPQQKPDDPKWKGEFIKVYLAFQPLDGNDLMADKKSKAGLLNNRDASAKAVYDLIVPLVAAILHGQRLTAQQVQMLEAWVSPSPPANQPAQTSTVPKKVPAETGAEPVPMALGAGGPK